MSKKKPVDKVQARERRNRMLETAAAAELSLTEGVREMRAIAGMTQEEFAQHRGVSARVIKAIELDKGNPTVATLNRIGQFFGLEVAFVPVRRKIDLPNDAGATDIRPQHLAHHSEPAGDARLDTVLEDFERRLYMKIDEMFDRHLANLPKESVATTSLASNVPVLGKKRPRSR